MARLKGAAELAQDWQTNPRWQGITRPYSALAQMGAERLWDLLHTEPYIPALGALTGNQAMQMVRAGLKAIYLSGWQVAADANLAGQMYPDQSLYPANSAPALVRNINNTLRRADQIQTQEGKGADKSAGVYWFAPIVADAEAGFGGALNVFELVKALIEAGAAGVHLEDQLSSGRQGAHPDEHGGAQPGLGPARHGRDGRADGACRAHRRQRRDPDDVGCGPL